MLEEQYRPTGVNYWHHRQFSSVIFFSTSELAKYDLNAGVALENVNRY